jgi:hypothetical protein
MYCGAGSRECTPPDPKKTDAKKPRQPPPPPSSIGFIRTESGGRTHDYPSATISPPPPLFKGWRNFFLMMIFFLFIVGTNLYKLFLKMCVKDTFIRQYSYKIELADN